MSFFNKINKSSPKSFAKSRVATPSGHRMDSPAVYASCAEPTADESLSRGYDTSTPQCQPVSHSHSA